MCSPLLPHTSAPSSWPPQMRRKVLAGTWLILSGVFPTTVNFRATGLYQSCLSAGAMFAKSVRDATHVIANRGRTGKVSEAIAAGVPVVGLRWLTESLARWKRLDERSRPMKGFEKCVHAAEWCCGTAEPVS